jgi:hypothetical protein
MARKSKKGKSAKSGGRFYKRDAKGRFAPTGSARRSNMMLGAIVSAANAGGHAAWSPSQINTAARGRLRGGRTMPRSTRARRKR